MKKFYLILCLFTALNLCAQHKFTVYFDTNKHELTEAQVDTLAKWLQQNRKSKIISMHGFTDEVGSIKANDTLSQKRVQNMYTLLKPYVKIRDDFKMQSYGKNHQQLKEKYKNRRVDIFYIKHSELAQENTILGIPRKILPPTATLQEQVANAWVGDKLEIKNIFFQLNTFAMMPESKPAMDILAQILLDNPNLVIEVQGHICCQPQDRLNLSTQRAKQVKRVLLKYGVKNHQVSFKGFGSTQPRFTIPEQTEDERAANRRVEIEILEN